MTTMPDSAQPRTYSTRSLSETAASLEAACRARDGEAMALFFAEQAVAMYTQPLPYVGREANRQVWVELFQAPDVVHPITIDEVTESEQGDLGYTFGRWWMSQPSAEQRLGGRWVAIWQPVDDAWQITHLSANVHTDISTEKLPA